MKIREGYYIMDSPEYRVTEADVMKLLRFLTDDIQSAEPQIQWGFHPSRSNLCVFVGTGLNDGKNKIVFEKAPIKGGYQIIFDFFDDTHSLYTMVDLCLGPQSELHELYGYVSRAVHGAAWKRGTLSARRTIILK